MTDERLKEIELDALSHNGSNRIERAWAAATFELIAEVRRLQALNSTTNSNWPHEKKLHERIAELEAALWKACATHKLLEGYKP